MLFREPDNTINKQSNHSCRVKPPLHPTFHSICYNILLKYLTIYGVQIWPFYCVLTYIHSSKHYENIYFIKLKLLNGEPTYAPFPPYFDSFYNDF